MKTMAELFILGFITFCFSGCLTPYDNEFTCNPGIVGKCTSSIIDTYKETINEIVRRFEQRDVHFGENRSVNATVTRQILERVI